MGSAESVPVVRELCAGDSRRWDDFVAGAPHGDVRQGWAWGEYKRRSGWQPVRLALFADGRIQAAAQVLLRSVAGLPLAYVPCGPVVPAERADLYTPLFAALHAVARERRSVFLRVEPRVEANGPAGAALARWLRDRGFRTGPREVLPYEPRATLINDLRGGPDAVLARMAKRTRYNVRLAMRRGVRVRAAHGERDLRQFHRLMLATSERQGLFAHPFEAYRDLFDAFRQRDQVALLLAEFAGKAVSGVMVAAFGHTGILLHSASGTEHLREMPNNLAWWEAMQWCMERGCTRYDCYGIPEEALQNGDEPALDDGRRRVPVAWGVYRYKRGFGGRPVCYIGSYDYRYRPALYQGYTRSLPLLVTLADRLYYTPRTWLASRDRTDRAEEGLP